MGAGNVTATRRTFAKNNGINKVTDDMIYIYKRKRLAVKLVSFFYS